MKKSFYLVPNNKNRENSLDIEVAYELGGINWYNGQNNARGYYLRVIPSETRINDDGKGGSLVSVTEILGKGFKFLLLPVSRCSKKSEKAAEELALEKLRWLVDKTCNEYELQLRHPSLIFCKDYDVLAAHLSIEELDDMEIEVSTYLNSETRSTEHSDIIRWYENLINTEDLINRIKEFSE